MPSIALLPPLAAPPASTWDAADDTTVAPAARFRHVGIGELKIGGRTEQLKAVLGSCVGIAFIWKKRGRCGLAHCFLPEAAVPQLEPGARYVSHAVPSLLRLMGATSADLADFVVVVAGGGMMLDACSSRFQVGLHNAEAARKHLRRHGLTVLDCQVGGTGGRTLTVDCATFSYHIDQLPVHSRKSHHVHA